ncbi:transcriptional repressor NrdR [Kocuria tytonicola]|uniref:Transcriptional repressor NrdR n=1 Tax=Kocuria tytonicola TaxID=2055946 RepID=A0A3L9KY41_9MICC|nr:transcriptional repressor NrdR [Kocuria tytonicola]RLZ03046.1 transcriptional repressor NrdR [Kocuria tytonicola]
MHCPFCRHNDSKVVDSRTSDDGTSIRRRRRCTECGRRFSTLETTSISVIKRSGVTEPFDRQKIVNGVRKACQGRPVSEDDLAMLAQEVEESIRASGSAEVEAHDVGLAILPPLRRLDVVAYLRFASVYQAFEDLEDFERAIDVLRDQQAELAGQQTLVPPAGRTTAGTAPRRRPARKGPQDAEAAPDQDASEAGAEQAASEKAAAPRRRRPKKPAEGITQPRLL